MTSRALRRAGLAVLAGAVLLAWATAGQGVQKEQKGDKGDKAEPAKSPEEFVQFASEVDLTEINLGRLAAKNGGSAAVKQYGERLIADHGKNNAKLLKVANQKGFRPVAQMNAMHRELAGKLERMTGAEFDRTFIPMMITGHKKAIAAFQAEADQGTNPALKMFAADTLPALREHLKMAEDISGKLSGGGGKAGGDR